MYVLDLQLGTVNKEGLSIEEATAAPRLGCFSSLGSQRKGGLRDMFKGLTQDKLLLPADPLVTSLLGSLRD